MKEFPPFRLDEVNQCLWRAEDGVEDQRVLLPPIAFAVLQFLIERAGRLVTQRELLDTLWRDTHVQPEVLKSHIAELRRVLGDDSKQPHFIETLPRRGYRFIAPLSGHGPVSPSQRNVNLLGDKLVGRDGDLAELRTHLQEALRDQQQIVFITGEAGIGKTTLIDQLKRWAVVDAPSIRIGCGQCIEGYGGKEAYYPMLEALGQLCRGNGSKQIVHLLAVQAPTWLFQFPTLLKEERPEMLRREIWGATRERMLREIGEVLEAISASDPLLLAFEDLHWADHSTVDLISALARRRTASKLMLVGTYRPVDVVLSGDPLNVLKEDLLVHHLCHEVALEPLREAEVAAYLESDSSDANLPEGLACLIHRHSEGNPLFMVAALEHMTQRGFIFRENGIWTLKVPLNEIDLEVPESLRQMIEVQIERLTTEEQRILEAASITVAGFTPSVNAIAANLNSEDFENLCEQLFRRYHIVRSTGSQRFPDGSFSPRYEFVHSLYRDVFYRRQSPGRRAKLHRSIGERLETLFDGHFGDIASELAHHFEEGTNWLRTVKYLRLVADIAGRRYAPAEAARVLRHALELSSQLTEMERAINETEILEKLAAMYVVAFDTRAVETYEAVRAKAAYYGLLDVEIRALVEMAYPLSWTSTQRCLEAIERALRLSTKQTDPIMRAKTRASCLVRRMWAGGWNDQDADACRNALAEIRSAGDSLALSWHLLHCNFIQWCSSQYRAAHRDAVESLATLLRDHENSAYLDVPYWLSLFILPWSLLFLGEWGEALQVIESGIAMGKKNGEHYREQTLLIYQAWVHLQAMDYKGVLTICESVLPSLSDTPLIPWNRFCRVLAGRAETTLGNHDRAMEYFVTVRDEMDKNTVIFDWYCRMLLEFGLTELCLAKGDLVQARTVADKFLQQTQKTAEHTWQAVAWETNARVALAEHDIPRSRYLIKEAVSAMDGFEVPLADWRVHATAGRILEITGDIDSSKQHRGLSRATILRLANSLTAYESLRKTFLSSPFVSQILDDIADTTIEGKGNPPKESISF